jgi:ubiquitin-protein ligase
MIEESKDPKMIHYLGQRSFLLVGGGKFRMKIEISEDYPLEAPKVTFLTQIYHPNIIGTGKVCLDILDDPERWNSILTIEKVVLSVLSILCEPNWQDPLDEAIARVLQWTKEFAQ